MSKVLLVDDVNMFVELQRSYLEPSALKVFTAQNGMEALELCKRERPELIFMDLNMPVMDGASCCRAVKKDPHLNGTRIVLITSEGKPDDRARCWDAGCDEFLTKPLDRGIFLETARKLLPVVDRRNRRVSCRIKAKYRSRGTSLSGIIMDLSQDGLYLHSDGETEKGAELDLVFALPEPHTAIIQARGQVAWLNTRHERKKTSLPEGFGMRLVGMDASASASLARFVEEPGVAGIFTSPALRAF